MSPKMTLQRNMGISVSKEAEVLLRWNSYRATQGPQVRKGVNSKINVINPNGGSKQGPLMKGQDHVLSNHSASVNVQYCWITTLNNSVRRTLPCTGPLSPAQLMVILYHLPPFHFLNKLLKEKAVLSASRFSPPIDPMPLCNLPPGHAYLREGCHLLMSRPMCTLRISPSRPLLQLPFPLACLLQSPQRPSRFSFFFSLASFAGSLPLLFLVRWWFACFTGFCPFLSPLNSLMDKLIQILISSLHPSPELWNHLYLNIPIEISSCPKANSLLYLPPIPAIPPSFPMAVNGMSSHLFSKKWVTLNTFLPPYPILW